MTIENRLLVSRDMGRWEACGEGSQGDLCGAGLAPSSLTAVVVTGVSTGDK